MNPYVVPPHLARLLSVVGLAGLGVVDRLDGGRPAGGGLPQQAVLTEDARLEERLDQVQDALVPDASAHPVHVLTITEFPTWGRAAIR